MKYVLSLSFGKDSMAMLIEVIKRKLPLDYVVFCDIRFNKDISGEHPIMAKWIPKAEEMLKSKFAVNVIHLTSPITFVDGFYRIKKQGNNVGQNYGFPYMCSPWCNGELKMKPIKKFEKEILKSGENITWYVGIAKDEPKRLERYKELKTDRIEYITLADLDINEIQAMDICRENNLLSPKYENSFRGGCWFCNRQSLIDLYNLWKDYPDYFGMLEKMEIGNHNLFRNDKISLKTRRIQFESGKIPKKKRRVKQMTIFDITHQ